MKKIYLTLLCTCIFFSFVGCKSNDTNLKMLAIRDNQTVTSYNKTDVEDFFKTLDSTINKYEDLAKEFKDKHENYSNEELKDYSDRVKLVVKDFNASENALKGYNAKLEFISEEVRYSLLGLQYSAEKLMEKNPQAKDSEGNIISGYNYTIERMNAVINLKEDLKKELLEK